ncbi:hypothetical protein GCM10010254_70350 [Streptomyces chromofuscus]|nr:hypothetical protein GCM10010254_70350 [Streptomyces chromofuscus]
MHPAAYHLVVVEEEDTDRTLGVAALAVRHGLLPSYAAVPVRTRSDSLSRILLVPGPEGQGRSALFSRIPGTAGTCSARPRASDPGIGPDRRARRRNEERP